MEIGILGGSFNPPHFGHLIASQQLVDFRFVDQVWLMPCFAHVWEKKLAAVKDRLQMCHFLENDDIKVSTLEIDQKRPVPTIETLEILAKEHSAHQFFWLIGEKSIKELPQWHQYQRLIKEYRLLVLPQPPHLLQFPQALKVSPIPQLLTNNPTSVSRSFWVQTTLSSTIIRKRVAKGLSLKGFVPDRVATYIKKHGLYQ